MSFSDPGPQAQAQPEPAESSVGVSPSWVDCGPGPDAGPRPHHAPLLPSFPPRAQPRRPAQPPRAPLPPPPALPPQPPRARTAAARRAPPPPPPPPPRAGRWPPLRLTPQQAATWSRRRRRGRRGRQCRQRTWRCRRRRGTTPTSRSCRQDLGPRVRRRGQRGRVHCRHLGGRRLGPAVAQFKCAGLVLGGYAGAAGMARPGAGAQGVVLRHQRDLWCGVVWWVVVIGRR